ncbi:capsular biosynthesis protein [Bacillus sp. BRMEA1]|uniref:YveK family protein n=1 Tax=Neobacillus endophyticus TaxID=2738405 RepID=UPI0015661F08|nr:Wzz/FepE/Etk N-terminal domain-containing protein [Neobacillus endophyticus]NRD76340.1 capsular biosynthesis protein [Neobacillus endophyticus]
MKDTISLIVLFKTLKKRWKLIVLMILAAALGSGYISYYFLKPVYQASTQILVNQKDAKNQLDYTLLQGNVSLINTYSEIIKSPAILEKVVRKLNLKENADGLNSQLTINSRNDSQVFSIVVEDQDAAQAVNIANTVSETFKEEIPSIMSVNNVSILAKAELKENPVPVKPKRSLNIAVGIVLGLLGGIILSFLLDFMDNTLKDEQDVAELLGVPVLGSIKKMSRVEKRMRTNTKMKEMGSETFVSR